jgi:hypothetical protein
MAESKKTWVSSLARSWNKWTPPDRPSPGEMAVYEEVLQGMLKKNKKPAIAVLGSTSEFRDLAAKYKLPCTVIEYNPTNYDALGSLMKRKKFKEKLVVGDWRTFKTPARFDLMLGDFCLNVILKKDVEAFVKNIERHLTPTGVCMLKTFARYDAERGSLAGRLKFYRTKKKHRPILESVMASMFKSVYNYKKEVGTFVDLWQKFLALQKNKLINAREFAYFKSLNLGAIPIKYYIPYLPELLEVVRAHATLLGVRYGNDWFALDVPIVVFRRS